MSLTPITVCLSTTAPEHLEIKEELLSEHQKELAAMLGVKMGGSKLCLTLLNKKAYKCHYRNLRYNMFL